MSAPIRLALLDDHGLFREGLSRLLADEPGVRLLAHGGSLQTLELLLEQAATPREAVDLLLLDFDLGNSTAFDVLAWIRAREPGARVLLVTAGMSAQEMARALSEGVCGVFLKHSPPSDLMEAIRAVLAGGIWLDPLSARRVAEHRLVFQGPGEVGRLTLTARERAVLRGVFEGRANKEIAATLDTSEGTVKGVLQQLFAKTGVRTRAQLVRIALEQRYDSPAEP